MLRPDSLTKRQSPEFASSNYEPYGIRDKTHLRFFTRKSAPRLFDESGLKIIRMEGINEERYPSILRKIAFQVFRNYLDDTRHILYAIVAKPFA